MQKTTRRVGVWRESAMTSHITIQKQPDGRYRAETMGKSADAPTEAEAARALKQLVEHESKAGGV